MIVLIGDIHDLRKFGVRLDSQTKKILRKVWPGKVSIVFPVSKSPKFKYLHRGTGTLAFRMPKPKWLNALLKRTGPLVAPSANFEGRPPALTVNGAKSYFEDRVEFYVDMGRRASRPSTLIAFANGTLSVLRPGAARIPARMIK